tara:strand:+ start:1414 stop:3183 length:1770 start_codon:yes stop_codon:yes gene_type:complete
MAKPFYEKSNIVNFDSNVLYDDLVKMTFEELDVWVDNLREEVISQWNDPINPTPPSIGKNEEGMIKAFSQLRSYPVKDFYIDDPDDEKSLGIIANFSKNSGTVNQFFPTMLKTKITQGVNVDGALSIYDYFDLPELREKFKTTMLRTLIQDSMCSYTKSLSTKENTEVDWVGEDVSDFFAKFSNSEDIGIFLRPYHDKDIDKIVSKYKNKDYIVLVPSEVRELFAQGIVTEKQLKYCGGLAGVVDYNHSDRKPIKRKRVETDIEFTERQRLDEIDRRVYTMYLVRYYPKKFNIFPKALQTFRLSLGQPAVNFPAMTARFLYEHFTNHIPEDQKITVYDPSAGWGGRILGAMSTSRPLHYVGTDPNTDNHNVTANISGEEKTQSRYEWVADFFNEKALPLTEYPEYANMYKRDLKKLDPNVVEQTRQEFRFNNTHHIFDQGSEVIGEHPDFQQYKGKLDFVFTSPPYFNREQYSQDEAQSFKSYTPYEVWRDKFLYETLKTAAEWLANDRWLLWNIADIKVNQTKAYPTGYLPLQEDSRDILESLGLEYKGVIKMALTAMVGLDVSELENSFELNGKAYKYEPIYCYYKK